MPLDISAWPESLDTSLAETRFQHNLVNAWTLERATGQRRVADNSWDLNFHGSYGQHMVRPPQTISDPSFIQTPFTSLSAVRVMPHVEKLYSLGTGIGMSLKLDLLWLNTPTLAIPTSPGTGFTTAGSGRWTESVPAVSFTVDLYLARISDINEGGNEHKLHVTFVANTRSPNVFAGTYTPRDATQPNSRIDRDDIPVRDARSSTNVPIPSRRFFIGYDLTVPGASYNPDLTRTQSVAVAREIGAALGTSGLEFRNWVIAYRIIGLSSRSSVDDAVSESTPLWQSGIYQGSKSIRVGDFQTGRISVSMTDGVQRSRAAGRSILLTERGTINVSFARRVAPRDISVVDSQVGTILVDLHTDDDRAISAGRSLNLSDIGDTNVVLTTTQNPAESLAKVAAFFQHRPNGSARGAATPTAATESADVLLIDDSVSDLPPSLYARYGNGDDVHEFARGSTQRVALKDWRAYTRRVLPYNSPTVADGATISLYSDPLGVVPFNFKSVVKEWVRVGSAPTPSITTPDPGTSPPPPTRDPVTDQHILDTVFAKLRGAEDEIDLAHDTDLNTLTIELSGEPFTSAQKTKLAGIATGATANAGDITGVTTGRGLEGGANSGVANVQAVAKAIINAVASGNTLTLTHADNTTTTFTATGGGSSPTGASIVTLLQALRGDARLEYYATHGRLHSTMPSVSAATYAVGDEFALVGDASNPSGVYEVKPNSGMTNTRVFTGWSPVRLSPSTTGFDLRAHAVHHGGTRPTGAPTTWAGWVYDEDSGELNEYWSADVGSQVVNQIGSSTYTAAQIKHGGQGLDWIYQAHAASAPWTVGTAIGFTKHVQSGTPFAPTAKHASLIHPFAVPLYHLPAKVEEAGEIIEDSTWSDAPATAADPSIFVSSNTAYTASNIVGLRYVFTSTPPLTAAGENVAVKMPVARLDRLNDYRLASGTDYYGLTDRDHVASITQAGGFAYFNVSGVQITTNAKVRMQVRSTIQVAESAVPELPLDRVGIVWISRSAYTALGSATRTNGITYFIY